MNVSNNIALELISINKSFSIKIDNYESKNNKNLDIKIPILKNISLQVAKAKLLL